MPTMSLFESTSTYNCSSSLGILYTGKFPPTSVPLPEDEEGRGGEGKGEGGGAKLIQIAVYTGTFLLAGFIFYISKQNYSITKFK